MGLSAVGRRMCLGSRGVPSARRFPNTSSALSGPRASEQKMRSVSPRLHSQGLSGSLVCVCCELQAPGRMGGGDREGRAPLPSDLETLGAPPYKADGRGGKAAVLSSQRGRARKAGAMVTFPSLALSGRSPTCPAPPGVRGAPGPQGERLGLSGFRLFAAGLLRRSRGQEAGVSRRHAPWTRDPGSHL